MSRFYDFTVEELRHMGTVITDTFLRVEVGIARKRKEDGKEQPPAPAKPAPFSHLRQGMRYHEEESQ